MMKAEGHEVSGLPEVSGTLVRYAHENMKNNAPKSGAQSVLARALQDFVPGDPAGYNDARSSAFAHNGAGVAADGRGQAGKIPQAEFFELLPRGGALKTFAKKPPVEISAAVDLDAVRKQAFASGEEKQRLEAHAEFAARLQAIETGHMAEINRLKSQTAELAAGLEKGLETGLQKIAADLSRQIADILMNFIGERLTHEAVRQFADRIAIEALSAEQPLTIEGNGELLDALQSCPGFNPARYRLRPTNNREIRIMHGDGVLSTRLAARLKELKELI